MSHIEQMEPEIAGPGSGGDGWMVLIFDNPYNSMQDVIDILIAATGCPMDEAVTEMLEAHETGKAVVHYAGEEECRKVADKIASIGVKTEVRPEWR